MALDPGIFKAYDIRGTYPDQLDEQGARAVGRAFVAYLKARRIGVGRDMRLSSPALAAAFDFLFTIANSTHVERS